MSLKINSIIVSKSIDLKSSTLGGSDNLILASTNSSVLGGSFNIIGTNSFDSMIIGGNQNTIIGSSNSLILGGCGLSLSGTDGLVYVPELKIATASICNTADRVLVLDSDGHVRYRESSTITGNLENQSSRH